MEIENGFLDVFGKLVDPRSIRACFKSRWNEDNGFIFVKWKRSETEKLSVTQQTWMIKNLNTWQKIKFED